MKNTDIILDVKTFASSTFTDVRFEAADLIRDSIAVTSHTSGTDYIYFGYRKPIHAAYLTVDTANTTSDPTVSLEYYNGTTWASLSEVIDDTKGLTRDGFIQWEQPTDFSLVPVDSVSKYWIRLSVDTAADTSIFGISLLFSDDRSIVLEYPDILDSGFQLGQSSLIYHHLAARNYVIQKLNSRGLFKVNQDSGDIEDLNIWDLMNEEQLRQAATFYALHKIFDSVSDGEDHYSVKSENYLAKAENAMKLYRITYDKDDDGKVDSVEKRFVIKSGRLVR